MSGGMMDYIYASVEEYCVGRMEDAEMNDLMKDLVEVLHDCEWWQSDDIGEEDYRETLSNFKKKWLKQGWHYPSKGELPPPERVLILLNEKRVVIERLRWTGQFYMGEDCDYAPSEITAWMPLPEPPKEEE